MLFMTTAFDIVKKVWFMPFFLFFFLFFGHIADMFSFPAVGSLFITCSFSGPTGYIILRVIQWGQVYPYVTIKGQLSSRFSPHSFILWILIEVTSEGSCWYLGRLDYNWWQRVPALYIRCWARCSRLRICACKHVSQSCVRKTLLELSPGCQFWLFKKTCLLVRLRLLRVICVFNLQIKNKVL